MPTTFEELVEAEAMRVAGPGWYDVSPAHQALYRAGSRALLWGLFVDDTWEEGRDRDL